MTLLFIQNDFLPQFPEFAVHPDADKAVLEQFLQFLVKLPLLAPDDRGQDVEFGPVGKGKDGLHHHVDGLGTDLPAALVAMRDADPGEEEAEIVIYLRDRADGGTGILTGGALLDGDGRRQSLDGLHVRLVHLAEELPGVGGQRFHVPPLPLGEDRVERQGGLAGPREPGEHDEPVARQVQVDVAQVVLAGAADEESVTHPTMVGDRSGKRTCVRRRSGSGGTAADRPSASRVTTCPPSL